MAPVGVDDEVLGMLVCARRTGSRRWTDGEGVAALELGHDLGRAIANAHATQRERRLLEELRELEESRHRFLRELTHEINNPMTVIAANAEFLATERVRQRPRPAAGRRPSCAAASGSATCSRGWRCSPGSATRSTRRR